MIHMIRDEKVLDDAFGPQLRWLHQDDHMLAYERGGLLFVFNFDPWRTHENYVIPVTAPCDHELLLCTDDWCYNGFGRVHHELRSAYVPGHDGPALQLGLPPRTAVVLKPVK